MEEAARQIRGRVIEMSHRGKAAHLGSALSCVDILTAAYWGATAIDPARAADPARDRLILSKGHAACALYATLAQRGFFDPARLDDFGAPGCKLEEHPGPFCAPGVEAATGALGHGLSLGLGMALAGRITRTDYRVYVVMGDGECNEGSVWEAAMLAPALGLENLMVVVDFNRWQATGRSCQITALAPLTAKWRAFGWNACEVDGHDVGALAEALAGLPDDTGRPCAVIAHTVKGKGVSFMEDDNNWHYRIPNAEEVERARKELGLS
jgi:transketolase